MPSIPFLLSGYPPLEEGYYSSTLSTSCVIHFGKQDTITIPPKPTLLADTPPSIPEPKRKQSEPSATLIVKDENHAEFKLQNVQREEAKDTSLATHFLNNPTMPERTPITITNPVISGERPNLPKTLSTLPIEQIIKLMVQALLTNDIEGFRRTLNGIDGHPSEIEAGLEQLSKYDTRLIVALRTSIGKNITLETKTKGSQSGSVASIDNNKIRLDRPFVINGEAKGVATVLIDLSDLKLATQDQIIDYSAPKDAEQWYLRTLVLIRERDMENALAAARQAIGHPMQPGLIIVLTNEASAIREEQARKSWAQIYENGSKAQNSIQAKAIIKEIQRFEQVFSETNFLNLPEHQATMASLKDELKRILIGVDPALVNSFKGRLEAFEPRTMNFQLRYTFKDESQLLDWSTKQITGQDTYVKLNKDGVTYATAGRAADYFKCPFVYSGNFSLILTYKSLQRERNMFWFQGENSRGKAEPLVLVVGIQNIYLMTPLNAIEGSNLFIAKSTVGCPIEGKMEIGCQGDRYYFTVNGKLLLEHRTGKINDHIGFRWGTGWDSSIVVSEAIFSGRAVPSELAKWLTDHKLDAGGTKSQSPSPP